MLDSKSSNSSVDTSTAPASGALQDASTTIPTNPESGSTMTEDNNTHSHGRRPSPERPLPRRPTSPITRDHAPPRPTVTHTASFQTRYVEMLLHLDKIPRLYNLMASFFTWILLAGFIVFPGTFTNLQTVNTDNSDANEVEQALVDTVKNAPLLWVAGASCVVGAAGMVYLWIRWGRNYVWVINRIFLPGLLNGLTGLISTFVNIYTAQNGEYSVTATATIVVTAATAVITGLLFALYNFVIISRVKKAHEKQMALTGQEINESILDKVRKPGLDPESVV